MSDGEMAALITTSGLASLPAGFAGQKATEKALMKTGGVYTSQVAFRGYVVSGTIGLATGAGVGAFLGGKFPFSLIIAKLLTIFNSNDWYVFS
jgi:hypothetical protein